MPALMVEGSIASFMPPAPVTLQVESLTLQNGYSRTTGGAINITSGNLALEDITLSGNYAERGAGGALSSGE